MKKTRPHLALAPPLGASHGTLRPEVREWVAAVGRDYVLEPHHRQILELAAVQLSRAAAAREVLDAEGLTYVDRFRQPKERPEVAVERNAANAARLLLRELALDMPRPDGHRPPRIGG